VGKKEKLLKKILLARSDNNIDFESLCNLMKSLGFSLRIKGGHYIFYKEGVTEIINLQEKEGKAKPYQVKQIRLIIVKYKLEF